jgi:peptide/nickel transport system permease protein
MKGTTARLIVNRLGVALLTLLAVSVAIFTITNLLPGDFFLSLQAAEAGLGMAIAPLFMAWLQAAVDATLAGARAYCRP